MAKRALIETPFPTTLVVAVAIVACVFARANLVAGKKKEKPSRFHGV